jgi:pyrroloquinoline quinone biosynthesis protein D
MIERSSRPKLAAKVRLRHDVQTGKYMLLYPEKGLLLNATGSEIAKLCTGEHTVDAMLATLRSTFGDAAPSTLDSEVMTFLVALEQRGLLEVLP